MTPTEFRSVLDWYVCSDPFPPSVNQQVIEDWLDRESKARGYADRIVAYHQAPK